MRQVIVCSLLVLVGCGDDDTVPGDASAGATDAGLIGMDATAGADGGGTTPFDGGPGAIGSPCTSTTECSGMDAVCLQMVIGASFPNWPGGYCARRSCSFGSTVCGEGAGCTPIPGSGPHCLRRCETSTECRTADGYTCQVNPFLMAERYCLPAPDAG